jgi:hypothetical protein
MHERSAEDRRSSGQTDRRQRPRGGRRARERRAKWQHLTWLVAAYAIYLAIRTVPAVFRRVWRRKSS